MVHEVRNVLHTLYKSTTVIKQAQKRFISTLPLLVQVFWAKRATAVQMGNLRSANAAKKLMLRSMWSCLGFGGFYQVWFQLPVRRTSLGGGDGGGILFDAVRVGFVAFTPLVWRDVFLDSMFQFGLFVSAFSGLHLKVFWGLCVSAGQLWIPICLVCLFGGPWRQWVVHFLGTDVLHLAFLMNCASVYKRQKVWQQSQQQWGENKKTTPCNDGSYSPL